jgi:hypothetical protein
MKASRFVLALVVLALATACTADLPTAVPTAEPDAEAAANQGMMGSGN